MYRFEIFRYDAAREDRDDTSLDREDSAEGVWGCHTITRCIEVCPKNVRPTDGIEGPRRTMLVKKFKKLVGK